MTAEFIGLLAVYLAVLLAIAPIPRALHPHRQGSLRIPADRPGATCSNAASTGWRHRPAGRTGWKRYALAVLAE